MKTTRRVIALLVGVMIATSACGDRPITNPEEAAPTSSTLQERETVTTTPVPVEATPREHNFTANRIREGDLTEPTPAPEVVELPTWEDRPNAVRMQIPSLAVDSVAEVCTPDANDWYNPSGPAVCWIKDFTLTSNEVGPCEIGAAEVLGHSHRFTDASGNEVAGALHALYVDPNDPADIGTTRGLQLGDVIVFTLEDGATCEYLVVDFGPVVSGRALEGSPAIAWPKTQFEDTQTNPTREWSVDEGEGVLYLNTSGGTIVNGHRLDNHVVRAILIQE